MPEMELTPEFSGIAERFDRAMGDMNEAIKNFNSTMYPILRELVEFAEKCDKELKANGYVEGPGDGPEGVSYGDSDGHNPEDSVWGDTDTTWDDTAVQAEA